MFVPFEKLPQSSKVWIYQADKKLSSQQEEIISKQIKAFTEQWLVHGEPLEASYKIEFHRFIVVAAFDKASGCSIDSSVRALKEIGAETGFYFFNRNLIAFKEENEVKIISLTELKTSLVAGLWSENSIMFNNSVSSIEELSKSWIVEAGKTWLKRYFLKETLQK